MEEQRLLTFDVLREQLINFALAYHKSERKDISNDSSEWASDFFKETPAPELLEQVAALTKANEYNFNEFKKLSEENERLTKENERLKGGSIENPDHHIKVLKEQISRMEDEYEALTEQVEKLKAENGSFVGLISTLESELSRLREERKHILDALNQRLYILSQSEDWSKFEYKFPSIPSR